MRRALVCAALAVPGLLVGLLAAAPAEPQVTGPRGTVTAPPAPAGTAILRGTVVASDTGTPVRRAVVRVMASEPADNAMASTDDQGRFEIRNLIGGRYTVSVSKTGYVALTYGQRRPNERGTPVSIAPGTTVERLTIGLPRGGVISGRIVDETGEPLADARVQVLRNQMAPGGRRMQPMGRGDTTDDQGAFRIFGLTPGDYVVSATSRPEMTFMTGPNGQPSSAPGSDQGYAPTYYPGTPSQGEAQRVSVAAGQEISGITFGMVPTRVSRISGRVVGGQARDADDSFVMIVPDEANGAMMSGGGGMVQRDGTFTLTGVAPGRYTLRVQPRGRPEESLVGVASVTVAGADLENVVIAMQKPGEITGRIEFEGGPPADLPASRIQVFAQALGPMTRSFMTGPPRTNDDFTFVIRGASGPTLLRSGGAPGWFLKSVEVGGDDVTDTPIAMDVGTTLRDVRILFTRTASSVSGVVRDDRGNAVLDATVVLFPTDETKWMMASRFIRTSRPGTEGRFELRGLPASTGYRLIAIQSLEDMQAFDPEFLATIRDRAENLTLAAGEAKVLDLRLR